MEGEISDEYEMRLPVSIFSASGLLTTFSSVMDTGFSGYLSLPIADIQQLGMPRVASQTFILGDNSSVDFDVFRARVLWDGRERIIRVLATEGKPLIGMRLLKGAVLFSDIRGGGKVLVRGF